MKRWKPKCRRCVPGHRTRIYIGDTNYVQTQCAICCHAMNGLELMKPRFAIVKSGTTHAGDAKK